MDRERQQDDASNNIDRILYDGKVCCFNYSELYKSNGQSDAQVRCLIKKRKLR